MNKSKINKSLLGEIDKINKRCDEIVKLLDSINQALQERREIDDDRLYTKKEAAEYLRTKVSSVVYRIAIGELTTIRRGRHLFITGSSLRKCARPKYSTPTRVLKL